ncbi:PREDICTED: uncharacterized protein LOC108575086 [Habropoda laboriosa]|uniref:uncharacterized protein LOC108575086 n=1 Tax=Habropoda laboriosa TaxID=597456 RepID=UPI00083E3235|nr:PREDICTED: uncharacterized protein LOC108575086 [Habropoda laboriosa]
MILESVFSCSNLLLTCGSSIYILINHSYAQYSKLFPHFVLACAGISMIGARSLIVLVYKLFFKEYPFDPVIMEIEEERCKGRFNILDEVLGTLSMAGLIYSLYSSHRYYILGGCVAASLSTLDVIKLHKMATTQSQETDIPDGSYSQSNILNETRFYIFTWVILGGYFAYAVGNHYALVANYPFILTNWALPPEGFYQGWTIRRSINDYMMLIYIMCMTEAFRQANLP